MSGTERTNLCPIEPREADVWLGRGHRINQKNFHYRMLVHERTKRFHAAQNSEEKDFIAREVIAAIEKKGGRFLRQVNDPSSSQPKFEEVDRRKVLIKVKQGMRDHAAQLFKSKRSNKALSKKLDSASVVPRLSCDLRALLPVSLREPIVPYQMQQQTRQPRIDSSLAIPQLLPQLAADDVARTLLARQFGFLRDTHHAVDMNLPTVQQTHLSRDASGFLAQHNQSVQQELLRRLMARSSEISSNHAASQPPHRLNAQSLQSRSLSTHEVLLRCLLSSEAHRRSSQR